MNIKDRMIISDFRKERAYFLDLEKIVAEMLEGLIDESGILVTGIEHRVKSEKSLAGKLSKGGDCYQKLEDITDLMGARIICYFNDDVNKIGKLVEKTFVIDWENSSDKRALINADSFGYLSLHYICSLPKDAGYAQTLYSKRFEIQIRTILQHAWAVIEHDLGYKSAFGVPRAVVREFARIAGLLEIADDEFVRTRDHINQYAEDIRQRIIHDNADDVLIDMISLNEYMMGNKKMRTFLVDLAGIENSEINEVDPESYISQLRWLGIETIGQLQDMLDRNRDVAFALAKKAFYGSELDILASNVALRFLCRAELCTGGYTLEQAAAFIGLTVNKKERAERQARHLFKMYAEIEDAGKR